MTARSSGPSLPIVLCIAAHKGGVGKTTTSMALAAALARSGEFVVLIDLDPQGHSTMGLGLDVDDDALRARTARELLADHPVPLQAVVQASAVPGLSIVPATILLERTAQWLVTAPARDRRLQRAIAGAAGLYSWIVIDCPPSLGPLTENALQAADAIVIPCRMEARATDGVKGLLEVLEALRPGWATAVNWRILRNARDVRRKVSNETAETMFSKYAGHVLDTVIPQCDALNQAQFLGQDIFSYDGQCSGAIAYQQLAEDVRALWAPVEQL
jgi:chromosome partitioning protein